MRSSWARALVLLAIVAIGWRAQPASAETVTFGFMGRVTEINPAAIGSIGGTGVVDVGDRITGSFTYDLDTPGTVGGTGPGGIVIRMDYFSPVPPAMMNYSVGELAVTTEPGSGFVVVVGDGVFSDIEEDFVDAFVVGADASRPTRLESVFRLEDPSQSAFSDTALPATLDLEAFDRRRFEVYSINASGLATPLFFTSIDTLTTGVAIDIVPGSRLNRINPRIGVTSVAILTTSTFDATTVDPQTVRFGPDKARAFLGRGLVRDVNRDGQPDLVLFFITRKTGIACGDTSATLTGKTFDGEAIQGTDAITTVGCRRHPLAPRAADEPDAGTWPETTR